VSASRKDSNLLLTEGHSRERNGTVVVIGSRSAWKPESRVNNSSVI
jgi:hypothetical protein